jgi:hypothetical protein
MICPDDLGLNLHRDEAIGGNAKNLLLFRVELIHAQPAFAEPNGDNLIGGGIMDLGFGKGPFDNSDDVIPCQKTNEHGHC